jgi:hypothetical protein
MGFNTRALEIELKNYAHDMVADHVKEEYDSRIRDWQAHINRMVDAQAEALKQHKKVIDDIFKQKAEQQQMIFGLAMLALSFVSGPMMSWIGGKIEHHWFPKFATPKNFEKRSTMLIKENNIFPEPIDVFDRVKHNEVHAKIFGDLGSQVVGLGIDKALKVTAPKPDAAKNKVDVAAMSTPESFKTNLENALLAEADLTSKAIMSLAMSILENQDYGVQCLAKLRRINSGANRKDITEHELEAMAKKMIREDINKQRDQWANKWFYYGYNPVFDGREAELIEREMWGLWLLNEKIQLYTYHESVGNNEGSPGGGTFKLVTTSKGSTFGYPALPELVLQRLARFGVVEARRLEADRKLKEQQEDEAAAKAYQKALEASEGADDPARDRNQVMRQQMEYDRQVRARRAREEQERKNNDPAPILVGHGLDTQAEIDALNHWATHQPPINRPRYQKRSLPSIEQVHKRS